MSGDPRTTGVGPATATASSPWVAVGVILAGSYASALNMSVVGVALPAIAAELAAGSEAIGVDWVVTGFLIGVILVLPVTGWLSDRVGRKSIYIASLTLFGLGAATCLAAPTIEVLVAGRFVQGLGGGAVMPVGMAVVYDLFPPHRRGTALGIWGVAVMAAPAAGPPLGGWIVTTASWRWIFALFVVLAAVAAVLSMRWLPEVGYREARRLDLVGWTLAAVGATVVVVGFRQIGEWGVTSPASVAAAVISVATFTVLVRRSLRRADPIIEFGMFAVPTYSAAMVAGALLLACQLTYVTFLPVELQVVRDLDAQHVGLLLAPAAFGTAAMMPIAGWLVDRIGARVPVVTGACLFAASMWQLSHLQPGGSDRFIVGVLVVQGLGLGFAFIPTQVAAMNSLPGRFVAQASAVSNLTRQLGGAIGVAVLSALLVADLGAVAPIAPAVEEAQAGYNRVFLVAFWVAVAAAIVALTLPDRKATRRHHADRAGELGGD